MRESRIPLWESGFHAFFSLAAAKRGRLQKFFKAKLILQAFLRTQAIPINV